MNSVINAKSISAMIVMRFSIAQNVASLHVATVGSSSFVKYAMNHFAPIVGRSTIVLNVTFLHVTIVERLPLVISVGSLFVQKLEIAQLAIVINVRCYFARTVRPKSRRALFVSVLRV